MLKKNKKIPILEKLVMFGLIFILLLHLISINFYLYWHYWWFDIVMHLLGGMWAALVTIWFFNSFSFYKDLSFRQRIIFILACVLSIAILWEIFEIIIGYVNPSIGFEYYIDTVFDILFGVLGGFFIAIFSSDIIEINEEK